MAEGHIGRAAAGDRSVEKEVVAHYTSFPYPWELSTVVVPDDPSLFWTGLRMDLGDWRSRSASRRSIWVPGCGVNQGVITAARFPADEVVATDVSSRSIEAAATVQSAIGLDGLQLREQSILDSNYEKRFDHIICTGVVHHLANPVEALTRLRQALRPHGVIELMVYNRYHRIGEVALQEAVDVLTGSGGVAERDRIGRMLVGEEQVCGPSVASVFKEIESVPPEYADSVIHPIEYNYTVSTLAESLRQAGLRLIAPKPNGFDIHRARSWALKFANSDLENATSRLDMDAELYLSNLLQAERSPLLWFYVAPVDSPASSLNTTERSRRFGSAILARAVLGARAYLRESKTTFRATRWDSLLRGRLDPLSSAVLGALDGRATVSSILEGLGVEPTAQRLDDLRIRIASSVNPHAVPCTVDAVQEAW